MAAAVRDMRNKDQAVSFIENRTRLGDVLQHDAGLQLWVGAGDPAEGDRKKQIWAEAEAEKEALAQALEKYRAKVLRRTEKSDVRETRWNGMMEQVQAAVRLYEDEPMTGAKGKVKWALHKIRDGSKVMEHWCNLLPGGDYGGTIAGVFSILATAANRSTEVRDSIFEAVQDVPDYIKETGDYLAIYEVNKLDELEVKSAALCKAILILFRLIVQYLTKSSARRMAGSVFQGDAYEEDIKKSKEQVEKLAKKIRREARLCESKRISEVRCQTREIAASMKRAEERSKRTEESVQRIEQLLGEGGIPLADMGKYLQALLESSSIFNVRTGQARIQDDDASTTTQNLLLPAAGAAASSTTPTPSPSPSPRTSRKRLLHLLRFDPSALAADLAACRADAHASLSLRAQDEAQWVVSSEALRRWLALPESRDLLVNGRRGDPLEHVSPLTLVCAEVVRVCGIPRDAVVAAHFCGLHAEYGGSDNDDEDVDDDDDAGGGGGGGGGERAGLAGMMASLVGQVVQQSRRKGFGLDIELGEDDREGIRKLDLECLCGLFESVVRQLPRDKIFYCIIDGISLYEAREDSRGSDDAIYVLEKLFEIVDGANGRRGSAKVKLLLTCPGESVNVGDPEFGYAVEAGEVLNVDCTDGDRHGVWETEELEESILSLQ